MTPAANSAPARRKGIILAGGSGTRLYPVTQVVSKQLLPVYDKPMIYYPLSTLMLAGIRDILLISTPEDTPRFAQLLGDGSRWGLNLSYAVQPSPGRACAGLRHRARVRRHRSGRRWCSATTSSTATTCRSSCSAPARSRAARRSSRTRWRTRNATAWRSSTRRVAWSASRKSRKVPKSRYAVTGLYFYDARVIDVARDLQPSARGEYEITDVNKAYLAWGELACEVMGRGMAWLDTGTHESLLEAAQYIETIERRQGLKIACPEEIAYRLGWIDAAALERLGQALAKNGYGQYLLGAAARPGHRLTRCDEGHAHGDRRRPASSSRGCSATNAASSSRAGTRERWRSAGLDAQFVQDNHSRSRRRRAARTALPDRASRRASSCAWSPARCSTSRSTCAARRRRSGAGSAITLSADNKRMLWVPPGFAHGFVVTSDIADFLYKTTDYWYPEHERTLLWNDPGAGDRLAARRRSRCSREGRRRQPLAAADVYP